MMILWLAIAHGWLKTTVAKNRSNSIRTSVNGMATNRRLKTNLHLHLCQKKCGLHRAYPHAIPCYVTSLYRCRRAFHLECTGAQLEHDHNKTSPCTRTPAPPYTLINTARLKHTSAMTHTHHHGAPHICTSAGSHTYTRCTSHTRRKTAGTKRRGNIYVPALPLFKCTSMPT